MMGISFNEYRRLAKAQRVAFIRTLLTGLPVQAGQSLRWLRGLRNRPESVTSGTDASLLHHISIWASTMFNPLRTGTTRWRKSDAELHRL
jgi:hypothetical protein